MSLGEQLRWERYMRLVAVDETTGCWNWTGAIYTGNRSGYGIVLIHRVKTRAHRAFYEHFVGPIPEGLEVMHRCDNRRCVNPDHLEVGTHAENMRALAERGAPRKHCRNGHDYTDVDVYGDGFRCLICRRARQRRDRQRKLAKR